MNTPQTDTEQSSRKRRAAQTPPRENARRNPGLVRITPATLVAILKGGTFQIEDETALQPDSEYNGVYYDPFTDCLLLRVTSKSIPPTEEGNALPCTVPVVVQRTQEVHLLRAIVECSMDRSIAIEQGDAEYADRYTAQLDELLVRYAQHMPDTKPDGTPNTRKRQYLEES